MPYAEIGGDRVHLEDSGGDGPPILLSHDAASDHTQFDAQMAELSDVYRVMTWDRPGRISAGAGSDAASWRDAVVAVFDLLDLVGVERAVLGGAGDGAELSLWGALQHPDRVRALVLMDVPPSPSTGELDTRLPELAMPVLLVGGRGTGSRPDPSRARRIADQLSDCRGVVEFGGVPSTVDAERPDEVNTAIRTFLESLPA